MLLQNVTLLELDQYSDSCQKFKLYIANIELWSADFLVYSSNFVKVWWTAAFFIKITI